MNRIIGIDLDNTIICYDSVLHKLAVEKELTRSSIPKNKKILRDTIRNRVGGEIQWQKLQAEIYGPQIGEANLIEGVSDFLQECIQASVPVFIVSHKTEFAAFDETRTNLRSAAMNWLRINGFLILPI